MVRHGESAAHDPDRPFDLVDGHGDPELHPDGRLQAERVADRLAGADLAALYVSSLRRTAETAAPLAGRLGLEPVVERDLREVYLGEWEGGAYRARVAANDPLLAQVLAEERWDVIPGAEPSEAFRHRVVGAVERIAAAHVDRSVAVFTHGGVIGALLAHAASSRPFAFVAADNASISQLVVQGGRWSIRRFNDAAHLQGV
ncbi:MAG: histidine phosphatase family protein [Actinomycetes bacterium]